MHFVTQELGIKKGDENWGPDGPPDDDKDDDKKCDLSYLLDFSADPAVCLVRGFSVDFDPTTFTCGGNDLRWSHYEINWDSYQD